MRIGCAVLAYEASSTVLRVLEGIHAAAPTGLEAVLLADDHSEDDTVDIAMSWASVPGTCLEVNSNDSNLGYGANQKVAFRWAMSSAMDVLVVMHGDGQHLPAEIPTLLAPIRDGRLDAVIGSRMLTAGSARNGGMPLNRFLANRWLSRLQNWLAGSSFSEWHSGFRAYRLSAIANIDPWSLSDEFDFDCAITLALIDSGARVGEVPCTTRYRDEISRVRLIPYGLSVVRLAFMHRMDRRSRPAASAELTTEA